MSLAEATAYKPSLFDDYLTKEELCAELGIHPLTLHKWKHKGTAPPGIQVGRQPLWRREAVKQWLLEKEKDAAK